MVHNQQYVTFNFNVNKLLILFLVYNFLLLSALTAALYTIVDLSRSIDSLKIDSLGLLKKLDQANQSLAAQQNKLEALVVDYKMEAFLQSSTPLVNQSEMSDEYKIFLIKLFVALSIVGLTCFGAWYFYTYYYLFGVNFISKGFLGYVGSVFYRPKIITISGTDGLHNSVIVKFTEDNKTFEVFIQPSQSLVSMRLEDYIAKLLQSNGESVHQNANLLHLISELQTKCISLESTANLSLFQRSMESTAVTSSVPLVETGVSSTVETTVNTIVNANLPLEDLVSKISADDILSITTTVGTSFDKYF